MPRRRKKREIYFSFSFPLLPEETSETYHVINVSWMEGEVLFSCCGNNPAGGASQEGNWAGYFTRQLLRYPVWQAGPPKDTFHDTPSEKEHSEEGRVNWL